MAKAPEKNKMPENEDAGLADESALAEAPVKKRLPGKVLVLYIALPILALLIGGGATAYFMGLLGGAHEEAAVEHSGKEHKAVFYDLPEILVNLNGAGKKETYLKIRIALELDDPEAQASLAPLMPRVIDNFQVFLREMRVEDLSGSAGMVRLKEELLHRINLSVQPLKVRDVLFKEMLIQ